MQIDIDFERITQQLGELRLTFKEHELNINSIRNILKYIQDLEQNIQGKELEIQSLKERISVLEKE